MPRLTEADHEQEADKEYATEKPRRAVSSAVEDAASGVNDDASRPSRDMKVRTLLPI